MTFKEKSSQAYKCGCVIETYKVLKHCPNHGDKQENDYGKALLIYLRAIDTDDCDDDDY